MNAAEWYERAHAALVEALQHLLDDATNQQSAARETLAHYGRKPPYPWCYHVERCLAAGRCDKSPSCGD